MTDKIQIRQCVKQGYIEMDNGGVADLSYPKSKLRRGRVQGDGWICPTITCQSGVCQITREVDAMSVRYAIRRLTPKECFLLMGLNADDVQKCYDVKMSDSSLYKQAGNGIVTNCVEVLGEHLYKAQYDSNYVCQDDVVNNGIDANELEQPKEKVKLTTNILFSGIGCQERGLINTDLFDVEVVNTSEISKESIVSYAAIHNGLTEEMIENYPNYPSVEEMVQELIDKNIGYDPDKDKKYNWSKHMKKSQHIIKKYWLSVQLNKNLGDISKIDKLSYADLWTVSFPCQSISCAGKMKGFKPDSGTRSSLLWENIRLLKSAVDDGIPPKYLMFENVKNLVSKTFKDDFMTLLDVLKDLGYNSYWGILNAKDFNIPQNRERVFVICIRDDIDTQTFEFPKPVGCDLRLKDILDEDVDEKYYIQNERGENLIKNLIDQQQIPPVNQAIAAFDLTENEPKIKEKWVNCITSRQRGISHRKQEGTGIIHRIVDG